MTTTMEEGEGTRRTIDWSLLPEDLIYEVLTRVPFESLASCRKVCSAWHRLTYEPNFISLHLPRTDTLSGYFVQSMRRDVYSSTFVPFTPLPPSIPPPSLEFLPRGTEILSSTHRGILLCKSPYKYREARYHVCKPATQQFRAIPSPRTKFKAKGTEIVASNSGVLHFKIVRLSDPRKDATYTICEIFDSRTWRWKRHREKLPLLMLSPRPAVKIDDVVYWQLADSDDIFAFDVVREQWRLIPPPDHEWERDERAWTDRKLLMGCNGQLCLMRAMRREEHSNEELELEIWKMVARPEGTWRRIGTEQLTGLMPRESVDGLYARDVVFLTTIGEAMW